MNDDPGKHPKIPQIPLLFRALVGAVIGLVASFWMYSLKAYWFSHAPVGEHFHGFLQGDQKTYAILIEAAKKSPLSLFYAYPWDYSAEPAAIFFQLPISFMAWLSRLFPSSQLHNLFDLFRAVFAAGMYATFAAILHSYFRRSGPFAVAFWLSAFGGGIAWLTALFSDGGEGYLINFHNEEHLTYWWFLHLFRNIYYPFEVYYHFLFFILVLLLLKHHYRASAVLWLIGLFSNPFLGVQMGALLLPFLSLELLLRRRQRLQGITAMALSLFFLGLFCFYYQIFLPAHEVAASLLAQHKGAYSDSLTLRDLLVGHSPWIECVAVSVLSRRFLSRQLKSHCGRLLILWLISSLVLSNNSRFLPNPVQPLHFTRGYFHLPLVIWSLQFACHQAARFSLPRNVARAGIICACTLLILDNALFIANRYQQPFRPETFNEATRELIAYFTEKRGLAVVEDPMATNWVYAFAGHPTLWGDPYITPNYEDRIHEMELFYDRGDFTVFENHRLITAIVVDRTRHDRVTLQSPSFYRRSLEPHGFRQALANSSYVVYQR